MDDLKRKLQSLSPQIDHILEISGAPALSLGVLHRGAIVHTAHFGRRRVDEPASPDDDTIHWVLSLTKLITAAAIAQLVYRGTLEWDIPIRRYLAVFCLRKDELGLKATLRDLLSCRTGITPANNLWGFQNHKIVIEPSEIAITATYLKSAKPFGQFIYSQWNYALIDKVFEAVTGASLCDYIEHNIFQPLRMNRSGFGRPPESDNNISHTHCTYDNGQPKYTQEEGHLLEAGIAVAGGAHSSIIDYLTFVNALLAAYNHQSENGVDTTPNSIFPLTRELFRPHVGFGLPHRSGIESAAYCMGTYRTKLPGYLSVASPNFYYTLGRKMLPAYGKTIAGTEIHHQAGTTIGHMGAMYIVPSTQSAVVAFTNSQPLLDPVDFAAQLALSVLLGEMPAVDFVKMAQLAKDMTLKNYSILRERVEEGKTDVPPSKPLSAYEGNYYNAIHNFVISVKATVQGLNMNMQHGSTGFTLLPYDRDTFYWPVNREEETCTKLMWGFMYKDWHLFHFSINANDEVESVAWKHDPYLASPEIFTKTPTVSKFARL